MKNKLGYIMAFVIGIWFFMLGDALTSTPHILILREKVVDDYNGDTCILVEYLVDGAMYNAVFFEDGNEEYLAFIKHLEQSGRIKRVEK